MCGWKKRKETLMGSKELSRGRIEGEKAKNRRLGKRVVD